MRHDKKERTHPMRSVCIHTGSLAAWAAAAIAAPWVLFGSPAAAQACVGDCDGSGAVTVDEIVTMVNIALGTTPVQACPAADPSRDGGVTVDEILQAVNSALNGCPPADGCATARVTMMLDFDPSAADPAGVTLRLDYPGSLLTIPGSGSDPRVLERVMDVSGAAGFFSAADLDTDADGTDDRIVASALVVGASYTPGPLAEAVFDCAPGARLPRAEDLTCSVESVSDGFGNPIEPDLIGCSLGIGAP